MLTLPSQLIAFHSGRVCVRVFAKACELHSWLRHPCTLLYWKIIAKTRHKWIWLTFLLLFFRGNLRKKWKNIMILIHFFMYLFLHCNVASPSFSSIAILIVCPFSFANSFALHIFYAQMCAQIHPHKYNKNLCLHLRPQLFLSILQPFHILFSPHNFIHL